MTALVTLKLLTRFNLSMTEEKVFVDELATSVHGTSARLREGDILNVEQLLFAMMLPSGNDAAFTLAMHLGQMLARAREKAELPDTVVSH